MKNNNILILYGTTTGNSEKVSTFCKKHLLQKCLNVSLINVADISDIYSINDTYSVIIICTSTWGVEPAVLQDDFELFFYRNLDKKSIENKKFAILALGDDYYPHFAYAAEILETEILKNDGILITKAMKIQDPWEDSCNAIIAYLNSILPTR